MIMISLCRGLSRRVRGPIATTHSDLPKALSLISVTV